MGAFVYPPGASFTDAPAQLLAAAKAMPGIQNAALVGYLPLDTGRGTGPDDSVRVEGRNTTPTTPDVAEMNWFTPGYLATAGIRLVIGRDVAASHGARSAPV